MNKARIEKFLKEHRDLELSAAKMEYTMILHPDFNNRVVELSGMRGISPEDADMADRITETVDPEELLNLMRKPVSGANRILLRKCVLDMQEEMAPLIKRKLITNRQDLFIENSLNFFVFCKANECQWILDNYKDFRSEYLKSLICLVLGFHGDETMFDFLMDEAERFQKEYPNESYDQGPAIAVRELASKYLK